MYNHTTYVCAQDIEAIDPDYYKTLRWMLENDITGVLDLTFSAEEDYFGTHVVVQLKARARRRLARTTALRAAQPHLAVV